MAFWDKELGFRVEGLDELGPFMAVPMKPKYSSRLELRLGPPKSWKYILPPNTTPNRAS